MVPNIKYLGNYFAAFESALANWWINPVFFLPALFCPECFNLNLLSSEFTKVICNVKLTVVQIVVSFCGKITNQAVQIGTLGVRDVKICSCRLMGQRLSLWQILYWTWLC